VENLGLRLLRRLDPERAHDLSIRALNYGLATLPGPLTTPRLKTTLAGLNLPNPIGLAAGFDKNARAVAPLTRAGFGWIELGAATPRAQGGNAKPRLFRLTGDAAVINRFGFNNDGADAIASRLAKRHDGGVVGLNLGANKDSSDRARDFASVLDTCGAYVDFVTVNVSSPNTANLRDLQSADALRALLDAVMQARPDDLPVFVKIAPDLSQKQLEDITEVALHAGINAIIATNTTIARPALTSPHAVEQGGLSGQPLFDPSTRVLAALSRLTDGRLPLVGVGGIGSAAQAYTKIKAGACALQLYSALVFGGLSLVGEIARGLDALLKRDGFDNVAQAVGIEKDNW